MSNGWLIAQRLIEADPVDPSQPSGLPDPVDYFKSTFSEIQISSLAPDTDFYFQLNQKLGNRKKVRVDNNTWLLKNQDNTIALRYWNTDIMVVHPDGRATVQTEGKGASEYLYAPHRWGHRGGVQKWHTKTTQDRLNQWLPHGWNIYTLKGVWYWGNRKADWGRWGNNSRLEFTDGDTLLPDGSLKPQAVPVRTKMRGTVQEQKKTAPDWTSSRGIYANLSGWPKEVDFYAKCPKCGHVHGNYRTMKEAWHKRLCPGCNVEAINKLKDYIAQVDKPEHRADKPKSTTKMFHEAAPLDPGVPSDPGIPEEDDIDPRQEIQKTLIQNWINHSIWELSALNSASFEIRNDVDLENPDFEDKLELEGDDGTEWIVYRTEDLAEEAAISRVKEDLQNEPEIFNQEWLGGFIDKDRLKRDVLMSMDFRSDFDSQFRDEEEQIEELADRGYLDGDDFRKKNGELKKLTPSLRKVLDNAIDEWVEAREEEFDVEEYFEDVYGDEAVKRMLEQTTIEYDEAAQNAVSTDGWAHFLATYSGDYINLKSGAVAFRTG